MEDVTFEETRLTYEERKELKELLIKFVENTVNAPHTERSIEVEVLPSVVKLLLEF